MEFKNNNNHSTTATILHEDEYNNILRTSSDRHHHSLYEYSRWTSSNASDSTVDDDYDEYEESESLLAPSKEGYINEDLKTFDKGNRSIWHKQLLPDGPWKIGNAQLLDEQGVKLVKFFLVSILLILVVHNYAIFMNAKRDETYSLHEMLLYDGNHIVLDIVVFFLVGRLYQPQKSVDNLAFTMPAAGLAILVSLIASNAKGMDHSITPHEIRCSWGWEMWALVVLFGIPLTVGLTGIHFVHAFRNQFGIQKMVELSVTLLIFLAPYASSSFFHLHHWYYAWLLGMHANANVWWSRLTMSLLWGLYINGVAIFGRDPIMTCAITLYQSQNQQCPYMGEDDDKEFSFESLIASMDTSLDCAVS